MTKVAIGIPSGGTVQAKTMVSVVSLLFETAVPVHLISQEGCYVHENRELIVREAQRAACTHVLFVDSDMLFTGDVLTKLLAHQKPIVGASYHYRRLPLETTVKIAGPDGTLAAVPAEEIPTEPFSCYAVGTGLLLVALEVFAAMPQPWFSFKHRPTGELETGEDVWFCEQARAQGFAVWCDPTLRVRHLGQYAF